MNATINYYNVIVNFCARKLVLCCRHDHVPQHGLLFLLLFLQVDQVRILVEQVQKVVAIIYLFLYLAACHVSE